MTASLKAYRLNEKVRTRLKHPIGSLILGSPEITIPVLKDTIEKYKPTKFCVVGDVVTVRTIEYGIKANLYIVDNKIMREPVDISLPNITKVFKLNNPPGTITLEAWEIIKKCASCNSQVGLIVDGEEDLLTLPVVKFAPIGTFVVYGQPHVGLVLVRVTEEKKKEVDEIIAMMDKEK